MPKSAPSPLPTQSVPSGAERTLPMECDRLFEGMQSTLFEGVGQTPDTCEPSSTVGAETTFVGLTVTRSSRETIGPLESAMSGCSSYV